MPIRVPVDGIILWFVKAIWLLRYVRLMVFECVFFFQVQDFFLVVQEWAIKPTRAFLPITEGAPFIEYPARLVIKSSVIALTLL